MMTEGVFIRCMCKFTRVRLFTTIFIYKKTGLKSER